MLIMQEECQVEEPIPKEKHLTELSLDFYLSKNGFGTPNIGSIIFYLLLTILTQFLLYLKGIFLLRTRV